MLKITSIFLVWNFLWVPQAGFGQKLEFSHFYTDDGLSKSMISSIAQDYQGFMWFGTFNGLNRFDGYSFKVYKTDPEDSKSLTSNHIEAIYEDSKKNLWIGTADGVNFYNRKTDTFEYYRYAEPKPYKYTVNTFEEGSNGRLYVGGWQGLCYVDSVSKTLITFDPTPHFSKGEPKIIFDIEAERSSGNLWLATNQGLYYYNQNTNTLKSFPHPDFVQVKSLLMDNNRVLWIGSEKGIYKIRKGEENIEPILSELRHEFINDIDQSAEGSLLFGTENGLYVFNERTGDLELYKKERSANTLSDNVVKSIFLDQNNHLWLGTFYGLNYNGNRENFGFFGRATIDKPGLKNPYVTSLCSNNEGHVFIGTAGGIEVINVTPDAVQTITRRYDALASINKVIVWMASDRTENIFISAWPSGIYVYNWKKNIVNSINQEDFPSCPVPVVLYEDDQLWMGCENILYQYDLKGNRLSKHELVENCNVSYLKLDGKKNLLVFGGESGMIKYNPLTKEIVNYQNENNITQSLTAKVINCIYEDQEENLWIATNRGLFQLDKEYKLTSFWKRLGFGDDDVKAITEDSHNNLWISTTNELYRFNRKTSVLRKFEKSDGLLAKEFSNDAALRMEAGRMFFGGKEGLIFFLPDSIKDNVVSPNVVITDFKILNQPVPIGSEMLPSHISVAKELKLDYTATEFSFEFVGLNFSSAQKNHYAYMMEGFDKNWNYSGTRRFASYTNLPAGREYIFKVKASNEDNVWNESGTSLKIYIRPPFWDTWWFKILTYSLVIVLAYVAFRIRIKSIREHRAQLVKQKILLQQEVKERTADLMEANEKLKEQAEKIAQMNRLLQQDNIKLEHDVKDLVEARVMQKQVSFEEFRKIYPDNEACYRFIDELKNSKDFQCKRCNHYKFSKSSDYSRRCSKCNYVETIITGTIFAGTKFPITKAFYLLFLISEGKHYTIGELSELVDLRQQTCWTFKKRVEERTKNLNLQKNKDGWSHVILVSDLAHHRT